MFPQDPLKANRRGIENDAFLDSVGTTIQLGTSCALAYSIAGRMISTLYSPAAAVAQVFAEFLATMVSRVVYGSALDQLADSDGPLDASFHQGKRNFVQLVITLPSAFVASMLGQLVAGVPIAALNTLAVIAISFFALRVATIIMLALVALGTTCVEAIG